MAQQHGDVLLLNANGMPLSLLPVSTVTWQDAIKSVFLGQVEVLHWYEDWIVRSPSTEMRVPAVILLREQVTQRWRLRYSAKMVFMRDNFTCQYCGEKMSISELTIDHVKPRAYGGKTSWINVVAACGPCNLMRGHKEHIRPRREPYRPTYHEMVSLRRKLPLAISHESWMYYLDWPEKNLRLRSAGKVLAKDSLEHWPNTRMR